MGFMVIIIGDSPTVVEVNSVKQCLCLREDEEEDVSISQKLNESF